MTADEQSTWTPGPAGPCSRWPAEQGETIRQIVDRAGDKWTVLVIGSLHGGPLRYTDLQRSVQGISQRMLTHTLRQLQRDGLVTRTAYPEVPPRVEYALTELGATLIDAVTALIDWAGNHHDEILRSRERYDESVREREAQG
ncbi:winged helix-turn-helix transcriptional regulator [Streptomyces cavernicola]|uniref:Helix-turn-helix domain-containing protein n=1 Tax=Streptomyces cavernicola TaxID=3043613 RepID=A0ABT6S9U7_9ACTN|nr:helix-turn-helix domain-containing protein [Streptomyces sp. B-S-A6]MDI3404724.1 helix-turn-helix domain-containing protein [Streptomyces sp. B-S-A6]